ncbi:MAG: ABC transporter permease [Methanomassiliicoccus sp.]|nr:ABC transporter permease [Methanomassiliicoccus sp.]
MDLALNFRAAMGRAYPRVVGAVREPSWTFFDVLLPLLGIAAYIFYYRSLGADPAFEGFVVLGGAMTAFWLNVLWGMAAQLYWEKEIGNLQLFLVSPMSRMALLAGMALGGMFSAGVRALSTLLLGIIIFNVHMTVVDPLLLAAVFLVTLIAIYGMGMLFASLFMLYGRDAWNISNLLQEPIYLVSGFYFPVKFLGFWVSVAASIIPITLGLDAMRQLLFGAAANGFLPVAVELVILCVLAVAFLFLAHYALGYMEELGRREGRLTLRWQ